jgi:hypothetical protein
MRVVYFVLIAMAAGAPVSSQPQAPTAGFFADNFAQSTAAASDQNAPSQNAAASEKQDESLLTLHATVSEVHLVFTVTDKHGRYIKDLKQDDFKILDDRMPPKEILSFHSETDLPLRVGLLIDTSQSVHDRFKFEQEADLTADRDKLFAGIHNLRPGSLTAVYDALYFACREKLSEESQAGPVRRAIILLSDGNDNSSAVTLERAIEMAQRAEVAVYTISTNLTSSGGKGRKHLERIADATGGRSYAPRQIKEVADAFASIQEELRSQYSVSYKPEAFKMDEHYRTIEVQARNQKGLRIRSRKGYRPRERSYMSNP